MAKKTNGLNPLQGAGFHRLPQIPTMNRSVKIAQSKTSAKLEIIKPEVVEEGAVIHIEGTDKVVKIGSDGVAETVVPEPIAQQENSLGDKPARKRQRKPKVHPDSVSPVVSKKKAKSKAKAETDNSKKDETSGEIAKKNAVEAEPPHAPSSEPEPPKKKRRSLAKAKTDAKAVKKDSVSEAENQTGVETASIQSLPPESEKDKKSTAGKRVRHSLKLEKSKGDEQSHLKQQSTPTPQDAIDSTKPRAPSSIKPASVGPETAMQVSQSSKEVPALRKILEAVPLSKPTPSEKSEPLPEVLVKEEKANVQKIPESIMAEPDSDPDPDPDPKEKPEEQSGMKMYFSLAGRILPRTVLLRESEKPTDAQLARIMEGKTKEFDHSHPVKWKIGDLLWGHVSGHPWWPGMISSDPFSGLFTTVKGIGSKRISRLYHVQYFGDEAERGWVSEFSSMSFEGREKFVEFGDAQIKVAKNQTKKAKVAQGFFPNQRRKPAWDLAVDEAEDAVTLEKAERIDKYTFIYEFLPNKPKASLTPKSSKTSVTSDSSSKGLKRKESTLGSDEELNQASSPKRQRPDSATPVVQRSRSREEGSFETYCIKHREAVREEHPDYSGGMVIEALKQQWALMTPLQRLRYKSKFSSAAPTPDEDASSGSNKRSPRKARPLLKKVEAESENVLDETRHSTRNLADIAEDSILSEAEELTEAVVPTHKRKRKSALGPEEDFGLSESSISVKSKASNDSDCSSDTISLGFHDETRPKGRPPRVQDEDYVLEIFKLTNTAPAKKENLCSVCQDAGDLAECQGVCQQYFHPACVGLKTLPDAFKCQECSTGEHKCFSCKKADKDTKRCSVVQCGKFYHEDCVKRLLNARLEGKGFVCPHHACATCAADSSRDLKSTKGRLYRCVQCPKAYHVGDFCVAAGSVLLGGYHLLCSDHFQPLKNHSHHLHVNVSWCFGCSKGGRLVCCETCPAAFHLECANLTSMPDNAWYCSECASGKKPLYGDIIWIKIGNYRWWPAEICHPRSVPTNIQEKAHAVGEFPARFFGSHDFYWTHQGRVFSFQEGDRGSKESASRGLFKIYYKGVKEATEAFKQWKAEKENKEQLEQERIDRKPAHFKFIKTNVPVGNVQVNKADLSELQRCECKPNQENPCGSDTECLNRMLMYECNPSVCAAKEACQNQRFQKREYPDSAPYRTECRGWGLKTMVDIKKGEFVNEYVGELIDEEECKRRIQQAHDDNVTNFYMLTVDKSHIIDAGPKGNNSRFMNHSCQPNLETQKWTVNGDMRVGLFAIKDIPAGSELTFNYNLECLGNEKTKCACGSENCSGFLGVRPKTQAAAAVEKKMKKKKKDKDGKRKKKRRQAEVKEHEDICFRCGEGGELVMCDKTNCPKVYHLQCLNLAKPPHGKWLCPWHHCDMCGKLATSLCSECPNSFCQQHCQGLIACYQERLLCAEHTDLIAGLAASTHLPSSASSSSTTTTDSDDSADSLPEPPKPQAKTPSVSEKSSAKAQSLIEKSSAKTQSLIEKSSAKTHSLAPSSPVSVKTEAPVKTEPGAGGDGAADVTTDTPAAPEVKASGDGAHKKSRSKAKAGPCRTKARYKSRVAGGNAAQSLTPADHAHTDSDNDSNGLVIDIP